jgi:hypothetical protein
MMAGLAQRANNMSKDERYREKNKTIRQLKSQVRQLRKELKLAQSEIALLHTLWEKDLIELARNQRKENIIKKRQPICPDCGNPTLDITEVGIWKLMRCNACDFFDRKQTDDTN